MEQAKQNLMKILLIVNLVISTCAAIGVGYGMALYQNIHKIYLLEMAMTILSY